MAKIEHILIIRLSALGDIAIAAPLVREYALQNPHIKFTMVSQGFVEPLFAGISNLNFFPMNIKEDGDIRGLYKVSKSLAKIKPTRIADLHGTHRSRIISFFLAMRGIPSYSINKNRSARKVLTRCKNKNLNPLVPSRRLYEDVFVRVGLKDLNFSDIHEANIGKTASRFVGNYSDDEFIEQIYNSKHFKIGIAPFAKHRGKCWPLESMEKVVEYLSRDNNNTILLFGGGIEEEKVLMGWEQKYPNTYSIAGKYKLKQELLIMSSIDLMISMDSANMHLASFVRTPVISIWGATHPIAGFYGWGQDPANALQIEMPCRPCSIFGNKTCIKGDYPCMSAITPDMLINSIKRFESGLDKAKR